MARWPTSKGVLFFLLALAASACSSDLFHSTEWDTICDTKPTTAGCGEGGGGGSGGGAAPGNCVSCLDVVRASTPPPTTTELCPEARNSYKLLNDCRCVTCSASCADALACGGTAAEPADCETCVVKNCGEFVQACAAPPSPSVPAPAPMP